MLQKRLRPVSRRAAVAVEFAVVAPVLLALVIGLIELSRIYEVQNTLETAAREGARFASIDRTGMLAEGTTANDKLVNDVKNYLASMGYDRSALQVSVVDAVDGALTFDLDDPANDLELFQVKVQTPYSAVSFTPVPPDYDYPLSAEVTFRNGRTTYAY